MSLIYPSSTNAVQKTLDAALLVGATTSVTLNSVVGIQDKAGVFVVDRVDANGTATPSKREYVAFTGVSGSTLTGLTRNADGGGSDQDHAVGAIVEFVSDVLQQQAILDTIEVEHNADGTHSDITADSIDVGGSVVVDEVTDEDDMSSDSDTAVPTEQSVKAYVDSGTVTMTNKTLTSPVLQGTVDGWISANETWAYASATTITVPSGAASKYAKGDKIRLKQGAGYKYFYVVSIADTVLTVTGGSDYTVATPTAITDNYYSHATSPIGFPQYFAYTPTGPTNTTMTGRFNIIGSHLWGTIKGVVTGTPVWNSPSLPVVATTNAHYDRMSFLGGFADTGTAGRWGKLVGIITSASTTIILYDVNNATTSQDMPLVSATVPITWANTDMWNINFDYEI